MIRLVNYVASPKDIVNDYDASRANELQKQLIVGIIIVLVSINECQICRVGSKLLQMTSLGYRQSNVQILLEICLKGTRRYENSKFYTAYGSLLLKAALPAMLSKTSKSVGGLHIGYQSETLSKGRCSDLKKILQRFCCSSNFQINFVCHSCLLPVWLPCNIDQLHERFQHLC